MPRRVYVASSWRNTRQPEVVNLLRDAGHRVYDFRNPPHGDSGFSWRQIDPDWEAWSPLKYRELLTTSPICSHGFLSDLRGMMWADTCVLVQPCGRSAHLELGWCAGQGKRTAVLLAEGEPELMVLLANDLCLSVEELVDKLA
jgi:hypothetical protein